MKQNIGTFLILFVTGFMLSAGEIMPVRPLPPKADVILPAARDVNSKWGLPLRKLFDVPMRDVFIGKGPNGWYYLTGTTDPVDGKASMWERNDGIQLFRSKDLVKWENLGLVWSFTKDATWQKGAIDPESGKFLRAIWAPEIHYLKGNFFICYSVNYRNKAGDYVGIGILRSTTGNPQGPYVDVKPDGPLTRDIDPTLFEDDDGKVYLIRAGYKVARLKKDLSGLAEPMRDIKRQGNEEWNEGEFMMKVNGKYILLNAAAADQLNPRWPNTYDVREATSDSIYGPYTPTVRALPHAGHNSIFQGPNGQWWSTAFGTDPFTPGGIRPYIFPVIIDRDCLISPDYVTHPAVWRWTTMIPQGGWHDEHFDDSAWKTGKPGFGDPTVLESGPVMFVNTLVKKRDIWIRTSFRDAQAGGTKPSLYIQHYGPAEIWINGEPATNLKSASKDYEIIPIGDTAKLHEGINEIAVHCATEPGRLPYLDVGIVVPPLK